MLNFIIHEHFSVFILCSYEQIRSMRIRQKQSLRAKDRGRQKNFGLLTGVIYVCTTFSLYVHVCMCGEWAQFTVSYFSPILTYIKRAYVLYT